MLLHTERGYYIFKLVLLLRGRNSIGGNEQQFLAQNSSLVQSL